MRIAFLNRGRETMPGGDCIGLDATMDALRKRGIECEETGWDRARMQAGQFDLAHIFHCNFSWSLGNYEAVRDVGLPYVLTPIYYPGPLLSGITQTDLNWMLHHAKRILPFSNREREEMGYHGLSDNITVLPNGTDTMFHAASWFEPLASDNALPVLSHKPIHDVLAVSARGDTDKNVAMVRSICDRIGYRFLLGTGLSRKELADAYRMSAVFVNASDSERMSLTIGEALCAGCRVLATQHNWGNEWYPGLVTFDPSDEIKLEHLIRWAIASPAWDYRPNAAARCLTWDWVAERLEAVYNGVLAA